MLEFFILEKNINNRLSFLGPENRSELPFTVLDSAASYCTVKGNSDLFGGPKNESLINMHVCYF